ncbi:MAG TPA: GTPase Era [Polyangiaceae bacterium]|nr:GTPase Era [Polyangiaceae bacterium]
MTPDSRAPEAAPPEPPTPARSGTVALAGRSNVGKSTLLNALLGEELSVVAPTPQTTRDAILGIVYHRDAQIGVLDTPGLHKPRTHLGKRMNAEARAAVNDADLVVFVADPVERAGGELAVHEGDRTLLADVGAGKPTVLALNKIDRVRPRSRLLPLLEEFAKVRDFAAFVPISARRRDGLGRLLDEVAARLPERPPLFPPDELSDRPLRFFAAEFVREQILRATRDELPYVVAVTVDSFTDAPSGAKIAATIHVEREGQKGILVGKGGAKLRDIGTAAREKIGRFLDRPAHLSLFVRVDPGWSDDPRALVDLGYGSRRDGGGSK